MYPSKVTDRFGNWISYDYLTDNGTLRLSHIRSSDNRAITVNYTNGVVSSLTDGDGVGTRTWRYAYDLTTGALTQVTLPDGSFWKIDFADLDKASWKYVGATCTTLPRPTYGGSIMPSYGTVTGTIQHPSGASGKFTFTVTRHGRNNAPTTCLQNTQGVQFAAVEPNVYDVLSLTRKELTFPHLPSALTWTLAYGGCPQTACDQTKTTRVVDPRNDVRLYTFGAYYNTNPDLNTEGQLLTLQSGGTPSAYSGEAGPMGVEIGGAEELGATAAEEMAQLGTEASTLLSG